jgi:hypothetical protein
MSNTMRNTHKYVFKVGKKIAAYGVTNNLERRGRELRYTHGGGRILQVGRKSSRKAALEWRRERD